MGEVDIKAGMATLLRDLADRLESGSISVTYDSVEYETIEIAPTPDGWRQCRSGPRRKLRLHWTHNSIKPAGDGECSDWEN